MIFNNRHRKVPAPFVNKLLLIVAIALTSACSDDNTVSQTKPSTKQLPNIVILYADALAAGDLGRFNQSSKIPTPNLDKLAMQGRSFTDAHSSSGVCSPSRYALLTGQYH
ncbi:sulfatase-like hydrolase/transferase [Pseudoalteromonas sp. A601]|uniref:sulfatase-like hydrolase/transferase n=1 Tax=Pseudoalteromonas sp. A601 TaxID=1967839 RepID=UPI001C3D77A8|nr:sulfatase-like hydrolase/transferase [Pseudoalteromonas sp. A601]